MDELPQFRLEDPEREWLEESRAWISGHFDHEPGDEFGAEFDLADARLAVVRANLAHGWVGPDDTWKLQALGIALGDALADDLLLEWITVDDAALRAPVQTPDVTGSVEGTSASASST